MVVGRWGVKRSDKSAGYIYISFSSTFSTARCRQSHTNEQYTLSHYSNANLQETMMMNNAKFHKSHLNKLNHLNRKGRQPYEKVGNPDIIYKSLLWYWLCSIVFVLLEFIYLPLKACTTNFDYAWILNLHMVTYLHMKHFILNNMYVLVL